MVVEAYTNPYDFTRPISSPSLFAGRDAVLKEISYYLDQAASERARCINLAIYGPRASGKSSLLNMIQHMAIERNLLPVKIPLNSDIVSNDVQFFKEVIDGIMTEGAQHGLYRGVRGVYRKFRRKIDNLDVSVEIPLLFGEAYVGSKLGKSVGISHSVLIHDLKELNLRIRERGLKGTVLLFDECDLLAGSKVLLQKIRNAFQELEGYTLVLAGTESMSSSITEVFSPVPRLFKRIDLTGFQSPKETFDCILKPLSEDERRLVDANSMLEIHALTAGSPYEINLVAHYMYRRYKESGKSRISLDVQVLDDVCRELERLRGDEYRTAQSRFKSFSASELKVLMSLLFHGRGTAESLVTYILMEDLDALSQSRVHRLSEQLAQVVDDLIRRGELKSDENHRLEIGGTSLDLLYLKYYALARGVKVEHTDLAGSPLGSFSGRLRSLLCEGISAVEHVAMYDGPLSDSPKNQGRSFTVGFVLPLGETTVTIRPPDDSFFIGKTNSMRFRVNVQSLHLGFVIQLLFKNETDLNSVVKRVDSLSDRLRVAGIDIVPEDEIAWASRGFTHLNMGQLPEAENCFDKSLEISGSLEMPYLGKAFIRFQRKEYRLALDLCEKALDLRRSWSDAWELKARVLFEMGEHDESLASFDEALKWGPENWIACRNKQEALRRLGREKEAVKAYQTFLDENRSDVSGLLHRVDSQVDSGHLPTAIQMLDVVLTLDPGNANALVEKAWCLHRMGALEDATIYYEQATRVNPELVGGWSGWGLALLNLGQVKQALEKLERALKLDPEYVEAVYNRACALARLGRANEALVSLESAITLQESARSLARKDPDFESMKDDSRFIEMVKSGL